MKYCVFVRAFYETPYINFFVEHYLKMGFDKIIILQTDNLDYKIDPIFSNFISIHKVKNATNDTYNLNKHLIKDYDWVFVTDIDEILYLNKKFLDIKDYISFYRKDKHDKFFTFRWGVIKNYSQTIKLENFYQSKYLKTMSYKPFYMESIQCHTVLKMDGKNYLNGIGLKSSAKISKTILPSDYEYSILIHLHSRSINNTFIKILVSETPSRKLNDKNKIVDFLNSELYNLKKLEDISTNKTDIFRYSDIKNPNNKKQKFEKEKYHQYDYKHPIIDKDLEEELLKSIFSKYKINYENYKKNIPSLEDQINKRLESI